MSRIEWHPAARADLFALYDWISERADPDTAYAYTAAIEAHCARLTRFPRRGVLREALGDGVRTLTYRRRVIIAYRIEDSRVLILRLIHTARDLAAQFDQD